jgi:hypothetical protein
MEQSHTFETRLMGGRAWSEPRGRWLLTSGGSRPPEPIGLILRPEIAAISMSRSRILVALNAVALKRLPLPQSET